VPTRSNPACLVSVVLQVSFFVFLQKIRNIYLKKITYVASK
jgi:hypothetical protein